MPFVEHTRISARFALGASSAPKEQASCTLAFTTYTPGTDDPFKLQMANDAFDDWSAWLTDPDSQVPSSVKLTECVLYEVGTDGRITADPVRSTHDAVSGSYSPSSSHPWQCSMVVTLVAGARGKGRFGRIYLPPQIYPLTADGLVESSRHTAMFTSAKTLLTNLSEKPGLDLGWGLRIAGRTGTGTLRPVTEVRLGKVADTQRRRRRSLDEAYAVSAFSG